MRLCWFGSRHTVFLSCPYQSDVYETPEARRISMDDPYLIMLDTNHQCVGTSVFISLGNGILLLVTIVLVGQQQLIKTWQVIRGSKNDTPWKVVVLLEQDLGVSNGICEETRLR
jgi:hypothetical protein